MDREWLEPPSLALFLAHTLTLLLECSRRRRSRAFLLHIWIPPGSRRDVCETHTQRASSSFPPPPSPDRVHRARFEGLYISISRRPKRAYTCVYVRTTRTYASKVVCAWKREFGKISRCADVGHAPAAFFTNNLLRGLFHRPCNLRTADCIDGLPHHDFSREKRMKRPLRSSFLGQRRCC